MTTKDLDVPIGHLKRKRTCSTSDVMSKQSDEDLRRALPACRDADCGNLLCRLFEEQRYTDVTFFLSGGNKESISAHRVVLASKSPFFEDLLFGEQTYLASGMQMKVKINDVPFSVFKNLVRYFYTGEIEFPDDYCVLEIYAAAKSFKVEPLVDKCEIYIESIHLTEDNVCSVLQACNSQNVEELKSRCISYIQESTRQVVNSPDFEKCSFTTVLEICNLDRLCLASEVELLGAILCWTDAQPQHAKKELTRSLVKCIRFLNLSPKEFSNVIQNHTDILTPEEGLKILTHLNHPTPESLKALPNWCHKSQRSFLVDHREFPKYHSGVEGRIEIMLKESDGSQKITELTSKLLLKCVKGVQYINSINFSFKDAKNDKNLLAFLLMKIQVSPNGCVFHKNYNVKTSESSFVFPRGVRVYKGQSVEIEVNAKITQSCVLLQYRWYKNPKRNFQVFISSKPQQGHLYCISGIEYETSV